MGASFETDSDGYFSYDGSKSDISVMNSLGRSDGGHTCLLRVFPEEQLLVQGFLNRAEFQFDTEKRIEICKAANSVAQSEGGFDVAPSKAVAAVLNQIMHPLTGFARLTDPRLRKQEEANVRNAILRKLGDRAEKLLALTPEAWEVMARLTRAAINVLTVAHADGRGPKLMTATNSWTWKTGFWVVALHLKDVERAPTSSSNELSTRLPAFSSHGWVFL
jgi:hypothetical protein